MDCIIRVTELEEFRVVVEECKRLQEENERLRRERDEFEKAYLAVTGDGAS